MTSEPTGSEADLREALRQVVEIAEARSSKDGQLVANEEDMRRVARARQLNPSRPKSHATLKSPHA